MVSLLNQDRFILSQWLQRLLKPVSLWYLIFFWHAWKSFVVRNWVLGRHQKGDIVSSLSSVKPPSCEHKHEKKKSIAFSLISYSGFFLGFFLLIEGLLFKYFLVASYLSVSRCFLWYFLDFCGYLLVGLLANLIQT